MKRLHKFEAFVHPTKDNLSKVLDYWGISISNCSINEDGSVSVRGNVRLQNQNFHNLMVKFHEVSGIFSVCYNNLKSFDGFPSRVGGYLDCSNNKIQSLSGCPEVVGKLDVGNNDIWQIDSVPKVGGHIDILGNPVGIFFDNKYFSIHRETKRIKDLIEAMAEYSPIKGNIVNVDRITECYKDIGIEWKEEYQNDFGLYKFI